MTPERWQQVKDLCQSVLEREPDARSEFLAHACSSDPELKRDVETLLKQASSSGFLDLPILKRLAVAAGGSIEACDAVPSRRMPEAIGRYRVHRLIGEGGMGTVYEAEQDHPRRLVALKVIKPGLTSPDVLRRFERESQALGRLQHPGIAQIFEAGTADTGFGPQPYFAMEFIVGQTLKEFVATHQLPTHQRLELFARICDAVQHAHERGLIHRDLKPGNILVDHLGQPRVLDFGVARLTDDAAKATQHTDAGQLVGTLAYMSPEQVSGDPAELDTRSDVYALGVILFELLANRLPYLVSDRLTETVRTIRDEEPARLRSISRTYRGDIDTIVAKALEKDKTRRYATAEALASDVRRHLEDRPIEARPASTTYQLQKFARRHKALVGGVSAVIVVLAIGVAVSTWQAVRARQAERAAVEAQQTAQAVSDFLQNDLLAQASAATQATPNTKPDPDLKVRTALDRAAARISGRFGTQPAFEAATRATIGQTYMDLGQYPEARTQLEQARDLYVKTIGPDNPTTLKIVSRLGRVALLQGKYAESEALSSQAVNGQRRALSSENPDLLYSMNNLGNVYYMEGKYDQAEAVHSQTLEIRRRVLGPEHQSTLASVNNLANVYYSQAKFTKAEPLYAQTLEIRRRILGSEHPDTLSSINNLAFNYKMQRKDAQAEALLKEAADTYTRVLGPEHSSTLSTMSNLAAVYDLQGKFAQSEQIDRSTLDIQRRVLGFEHADTLLTQTNLALTCSSLGKDREADDLSSRSYEIMRRVLGPEHFYTLGAMHGLASVYAAEDKYPQAEALFEEAMVLCRRVLGPDHVDTLSTLADFATMYQRQGNYDAALSHGSEALAGRRRALGSENADTMTSAADLAMTYQSKQEFVRSEPPAREAFTFFRNMQPNDWQGFRAESLLGASLAGQKKYAEAEPLLLDGYRGMSERRTSIGVPNRYYMDRASGWILALYEAWGKPNQASAWRQSHADERVSAR